MTKFLRYLNLELLLLKHFLQKNISATTVYLLRIDDDTNNLFEEYIYIEGEWELLGTAKVNLSGYATIESIPTKVSQLENVIYI